MSRGESPTLPHFAAWPIGGVIFGVGWAVLGGLLGALLFALAFPMIAALLRQPLSFGNVTRHDLTGLNTVYLAMPLSAMLLVLLFLLSKDRYEYARASIGVRVLHPAG
ncbi:MAG: hypothetical protein P8M73_07010 [Luminiphilus sp.]|nr:hypothetical protein [Luminiphilus sp.]